MKPVDVIIPIYNAYDFTKACIEAVILHTDLKVHTLVLINDKSTDERIEPLLEGYVRKYSGTINIKHINSNENHGFVKTVNIGMQVSCNDVVLLNSDTEVTKGWLDKMIKCAYSKPMVASVTPLSNNATIASVPIYLEENILPKGFSLEEYAEAIEKCSKKQYPELCTGHGFCMYITRKAIDELGVFDAETFGKGYGEENDFSYRAMKHGYVHLLADDTFVYHKGTQSFSPSATKKAADHLKILRKRFPQETHNTDVFVRDNPLLVIQENIQQNVINTKRLNILYVIHDFKDKKYKNIGGTTIHVYDLIENLVGKANVHVFYRDVIKGGYAVKSFYGSYEKNISLGDIPKMSTNALFNQEFKNLVSNVFKWLRIDIVHIHHTKDLFLDVFDEAFRLKLPVLFTFHDFYSLCPSITLLTKKKKLCHGVACQLCDNCYYSRYDIQNWQMAFVERLKKCVKLYAPTASARDVITMAFPNLTITVREHGYDVPNEIVEIVAPEKDDNFNVAFVGGITEHKGLDYLIGLQKKIEHTKIHMHLFGCTPNNKYNKDLPNYHYHGAYNREELPKLLAENKIHLVLMLQIWQETYSYTLSESIACSIPVLALDLGAVSERIKAKDIGYILPPEVTVQDVFEKIKYIRDSPRDYKTKVKNINVALKNVKSISQMTKEYLSDYEDIKSTSTDVAGMMQFTIEHLRGMITNPIYQLEDINALYSRVKDIIKYGSKKDAKQALKDYCNGDNPKSLKNKLKRKYFWYKILKYGKTER